MKKNLILFNIILLLPFSYIYSESYELSANQEELLAGFPADQRENILQKMTQADQLNKDLDAAFKEFDTTTTRPKKTLMSEEEQKEPEQQTDQSEEEQKEPEQQINQSEEDQKE